MAVQSLAIKYRPKSFDDVTEQGPIRQILTQQIATNSIKNAYLFCGGAGTGKTTCARIFANEINQHKGNAIEMDAASNSGVDDVREIIQRAKTKSLDSEYKVFIIDECHSLSNTAWQALLKLIEEPPAKSIFIFCTTDPQKIPRTILSRVQRYDFQKISNAGIISRLKTIIDKENAEGKDYVIDDLVFDYLADYADGGMRDAITLMDKCIAYNNVLSLDDVIRVLGGIDYEWQFGSVCAIVEKDAKEMLRVIDDIVSRGFDLKLYIKNLTEFVLDMCKYYVTEDMSTLKIPDRYEYDIKKSQNYSGDILHLLDVLVKLGVDIKWDPNPRNTITATLLLECAKKNDWSRTLDK